MNNSRYKRKHIIQLLIWIRDNGVFNTPSHLMLVDNWYCMYQRHNAGNDIALNPRHERVQLAHVKDCTSTFI